MSKTNLSIDLMLTHNCNFRCHYCYEKDCSYEKKNIIPEVVEQTARYIDWWLGDDKDKTIRLSFWGGEPSLRVEEIKYFSEKYFNDERISFLTFTNGYLIDSVLDVAKRFNGSERFFVQVSYDFAGQNRRVFAGGHPTKSLIKDSIKKVNDSGCFFSIKSTISIEDLPRIYEYYQEFKELEKELGKELSLAITPDTTCTWTKSEEDFEKMLEDFRISLKKTLKLAVEKREKNFNWLSGGRQLCTAGNGYICIDLDGKIYPCHGAVFLKNKEEHLIGNITEFKEFKLDFDVFEEPSYCRECDACLCFRCNAHCYDRSISNGGYSSRWWDFGFSYDFCRIMKEISKISYAYKKITTGNYFGRT